jgi:hypothetical protein
MRKALTQLNEYPEILSTPEGRVFAMVAQGFVEHDPFTLAEIGTLPIPGIPADWTGDSAYLSGYLFGAYAQNGTSRVYRAHVMPELPDSPLVTLTEYPAKVVGAGAACDPPR